MFKKSLEKEVDHLLIRCCVVNYGFFFIMCLNDIEENKTNTTHLAIVCCFATYRILFPYSVITILSDLIHKTVTGVNLHVLYFDRQN